MDDDRAPHDEARDEDAEEPMRELDRLLAAGDGGQERCRP